LGKDAPQEIQRFRAFPGRGLDPSAAGDEKRTLSGPRTGLFSIAFSPDGKRLAVAGTNAVRLHDPATGDVATTFRLGPPISEILQVAFSPDGRYAATANGNGTIYVLRLHLSQDRAP
jgi:WD40 repeat protein